ncbi:MAG: thiamine pyrophosphate-binding protein [Elusimicrobia bacterium]|nr:thiamine pyrophosphate-binding protein [Elusimicrobiota bacterium]
MKASDWTADFLAAQGVTRVYELVGGMITHLIDSMHKRGAPSLISVRHEQAAAFAADAAGRVTGVPGVAMATSGPGAVNLLTGMASCHFDSSPAVFITGQVNRHEQKGARGVRQLGFQETDIVAMAGPVCKAAWRVASAEELPVRLADAFRLALSGRPGPVLVDIPMDLQRADVSVPIVKVAPEPLPAPDPKAVDEALAVLGRAERPLILVGGGLRAARARAAFRAFVDALGVPVVHSLMAVDALPWGHPLRAGFLGSYGNRWVNAAMGRADAVLVLGSRLDIRQTGADVAAWKAGRTIVHVDADPSEVNNRVTGCLPVFCDLGAFLAAAAPKASRLERPAWLAEIAELRARWPDTAELGPVPGLNPNVFLHQLAAASRKAAGYCVDVGQHQMWAAQSLELGPDQEFHTSGGMGSMGFALPAAIGAAGATLGKPWVVVAGDGGFQVNIQELQTVAHHRLPLKLVVLNNGCHGMVRQFQESYFDKRYASTLVGYSAPDFPAVARAYGLACARVERPEEVAPGLAAMWADPKEPFLLELRVDPRANAYPKIAFGLPMTEMEPLAKPIEMEGT